MRLAVCLNLEREALLPMSHQHLLTGLVYHLLGTSDPEYARFLHDEGYSVEAGRARRLKLFVFSGLRVPGYRRRPEGDRLRIAPGPVEWLLASPREDFLQHSATGLLTAGSVLEVGDIPLTITSVEALPAPVFGETTRFTCLTPIVASVRIPNVGTRYLRPCDGEAFSEAVRKNLLEKYRLVYGDTPPADDRLTLTFKPEYLADPRHRGGTKLIRYKDIDVVGAFAPFTLTGSTALMHMAWECGLGSRNSAGFGMIDVIGIEGIE